MDDFTNFIKNKLSKPIILIGMMGSGKSEIGQRLADSLGFPFFDSDNLIEKETGQTIPEIFSESGEEHFRDLEKKTIWSLLEKGPCVVATGGGAVTTSEVLEAIQAQAVVVWLDAEPADIFERIRSSNNRPLLYVEDPEAALRDLLQERRPLYQSAHITVTTIPGSAEETLSRTIEQLYTYLFLQGEG